MDPYKQTNLIDIVLQKAERPAATPEQSPQRKRMRLHQPKVKLRPKIVLQSDCGRSHVGLRAEGLGRLREENREEIVDLE